MLMTPGAVRLLQVSDCHCFASDDVRLMWTDMLIYPNRSLQAVLDYLKDQMSNYQALMVTGDLAQEEIPATYQRVSDILNTCPLPTYAIPGNHDIPEVMQPNLSGNVQMLDEVVIGNWHLLLLDTYTDGQHGGSLSDEQFARFEALLSALPEDHFAAVFMHHHPVPINSEWMDVQGFYQSEYFWKLIEHFPQVKVVFNGHIHQAFTGYHAYADGRKVEVYGTPATCVQMKPVRQHIEFDHNLPAWRDIALLEDGSVATEVHYLPAAIRDTLLY
ncbi:MAG: hypothetical protein RI964_1203 [Pseudomonadota bacterium]